MNVILKKFRQLRFLNAMSERIKAGMQSSRGQSLVQVMISVALIAIFSLVFAAMISTQQKQTAQLVDKLASVDVIRVISSVLADGSVCSFMMTNSAPRSYRSDGLKFNSVSSHR